MSHKKRPIGVTLLAVLAGIAALIAVINTLQMLHLLPIKGPLGQYAFFTFDLVGAIIWGILAAIYIWLVRMLWSVDTRAWVFLVLLASLNLILAFVSLIGATSWQAIAPTIFVNGLILIYCLLPGTKEAFQVEALKPAPPAPAPPAPAPAPAPAAKPAPVIAPEPEPVAAVIENVDIGAETAVAAAIAMSEETYAEQETVIAEETEVVEVAAVMEAAETAAETEVVETAFGAEAEVEDVTEVAEVAEIIAGEDAPVPAPTPVETVESTAHASPGGAAKFNAGIDFVEGIGPVYAQKLADAGVDSPKALLETGATRQGRDDLVEKTGISYKLILKWVHAADLYRIKGVGSEYADLLDTAGVNTVLELAQRNPENLHQTLLEVNEEKHLVRETPALSMVTSWVEQAKELPRVISH